MEDLPVGSEIVLNLLKKVDTIVKDVYLKKA